MLVAVVCPAAHHRQRTVPVRQDERAHGKLCRAKAGEKSQRVHRPVKITHRATRQIRRAKSTQSRAGSWRDVAKDIERLGIIAWQGRIPSLRHLAHALHDAERIKII
jgi:hypothetical protein